MPNLDRSDRSKILCSQTDRRKNGFVTIMVVGHFLGGFDPQNFFLDIFFCPFFKISEKNAKKCPTSINALLCRGLRPLARSSLTVWINMFKNPFYAVDIQIFIIYPAIRTDLPNGKW